METCPTAPVLELPSPSGDDGSSLGFSPSGRLLAIGRRSVVEIWDTETGRQLASCQAAGLDAEFDQVTFCNHGLSVAVLHRSVPAVSTARPTARLMIWTPVTGGLVCPTAAGFDPVRIIVGCATRRRLFAAGPDAWMVHPSPARIQKSLSIASPVTCAGFCADGQSLATGHGDGAVRWWDLRDTPRHVGVSRPADCECRCLTWLDASDHVLCGYTDGMLRLWNGCDSQPLDELRLAAPAVAVVGVDGGKALAACEEGPLQVISTRLPLMSRASTTITEPLRAIAASPDGRRVATGDGRGRVQLWQTAQLLT